MRKHLRLFFAASVPLAAACVFLAAAGNGAADDKKKEQKKDSADRAAVRKIADLLEKGDATAATAQIKALAGKADLDDVMHMFSPRKADGKGGAGIGAKPGAIKPDCIEVKIQYLGKRVAAAELKKDGAALERMAYLTAAIAQVARDNCPVATKQGAKDPAQWKKWSEDMNSSALDLAKAVKAGDAAAVKKSAFRLDNTCRECHGVFRDS